MAWAEYREQAFGDPYMVWHDGPAFAEFRDRWREEPELAEDMLQEGLAAGDALAARTVREIADLLTPEQTAVLGGYLIAVTMLGHGSARVEAARSLYALTGDTAHVEPVLEELGTAGFWTVRLDAALMLREFPPTPELVAGARRAVAEDPEYLVRYHAANTLRRWAGDASDIDDDELFALILDDATPDDRARAADALASRIAV